MKLLRNASIGTKVAVAPVFAILCLVVVAGVSLWGSLSGTRALVEINQARIPGLALAADLERRISELNNKLNQSLVWGRSSTSSSRTRFGLRKTEKH